MLSIISSQTEKVNPRKCYNLIMAIKPICDKCKQELTDFGGILFSPPDQNSTVKKLHICQSCYADIVASFD